MIIKTEFSNDDLKPCMEHNPTHLFNYSDVAGLIAEVPGHNDEDDWFWVGKLKNGKFFGARGGCDYTGWDCQSGCTYWIADTVANALDGFKKVESYRGVPKSEIAQLQKQIDETQPFGMGVTVRPEDN